jgi:16S rRNA G1207 methylase RsmC
MYDLKTAWRHSPEYNAEVFIQTVEAAAEALGWEGGWKDSIKSKLPWSNGQLKFDFVFCNPPPSKKRHSSILMLNTI